MHCCRDLHRVKRDSGRRSNGAATRQFALGFLEPEPVLRAHEQEFTAALAHRYATLPD
jgi:hypothetical protein